MNALGVAVRALQTSTVDEILKASPGSVNAKDEHGNTAAHHACIVYQEAMWDLLFRYGPDLELANNAGQTPLMVSAMGRLVSIKQGEPVPDEMPPQGVPPFHAAGWEGNVNGAIGFLISGKVRINDQDRYGNTALHYASARGMSDFIKFCTESGADPLIRNNASELALHAANLGRITLASNIGYITLASP